MHYCKDKNFTPLDKMYALLQPDKSEYEFFRRTSSKWKMLIIRAKEIVKTLLRCRFEIFTIEQTLDELVMEIYKKVRPEMTAGFFHLFYTDLSQTRVNIFEMYDIKKKQFVFSKNAKNDESALTDSDEE